MKRSLKNIGMLTRYGGRMNLTYTNMVGLILGCIFLGMSLGSTVQKEIDSHKPELPKISEEIKILQLDSEDHVRYYTCKLDY